MAKVTPYPKREEVVQAKTKATKTRPLQPSKWWEEDSKDKRAIGLIDTAAYLKQMLNSRYRQTSIYSRLYSNMPVYGGPYGGAGISRSLVTNMLPLDRPTMNVVQSCVDTLVSRITQARPRPVFLTDNGDYKARNLAKKLNDFTAGEMYQIDAYELGTTALRDAAVVGTGCIKIYEKDEKVCAERVLDIELLVDPNDGMYGHPRQLYHHKFIDRGVLMDMFPEYKSKIMNAQAANPEPYDVESSKTASDMVMVVEGWHLPSGKDAKDGKHVIACAEGYLCDEPWEKDYFPFVFLRYSPRMAGFFGQPLTEQLMGTQMEINKLLITISKSINLVGVPRVFVEDGSKVVKAHLNDQIGSIITYRGTKPEYSVAACVPQEVYAQLQRLIDYAYQQSGISALAAASQKPAGLNAAVALREYDDLQSDRFASLVKRYDNMFVDMAYQIIDLAKDIADRTGSYQSVYPNKNGIKEVDLPKADLIDDPFVIQCFDASALPRDPAGRMQKITELIQAGMIDIREGRRLLDYPDLEQNEKLENASEERILQLLDQIVDDGMYTPPDEFMDLQLAKKLSIQYYNLYMTANLEPEKAEMLRLFNSQVQALEQAAMPPPMPGAMPSAPGQPQLAAPMPVPQSPLLPQSAK